MLFRSPAGANIKSAKVDNPKVASVQIRKGVLKITGKKEGKAIVSVIASNGAVAKVNIKVKKVSAAKVTLNLKRKTLKKGNKVTLKAKVQPKTASKAVKWKSSNKKVAKVSQKGVVTAKKKGKTTITVKTSNGKKAACKIIVK